MINGYLVEICDIWRRQATGKYGNRSADKFDLQELNVPCLFMPTKGEETVNDEAGNDIVIDGRIRIEKEILSTDRIVLGGYNYDLLTVKEKKNLVTESIEYYEAMVSRRRAHAETPSAIIK